MPLFQRLNGKRSVQYNSSKRPKPFLHFLSAGNLSADMHFLHGRSYSIFFSFMTAARTFVSATPPLRCLFRIFLRPFLTTIRTFLMVIRNFSWPLVRFRRPLVLLCRPFVLFDRVFVFFAVHSQFFRPFVFLFFCFFSSISSFLTTMFIFSFIYSSVGSQRFISVNICSNGLRRLIGLFVPKIPFSLTVLSRKALGTCGN